jgi:o-succinylbenzoate---CoA ligase
MLQEWLTYRARQTPGRPALVDDDGGTITYGELELQANATARKLSALGVEYGDRVAVTLEASTEFVRLVHAVSKLGAVLVPINTRLTHAERRWQVEDCGARLVVSEPLCGPENDAVGLTEIDPQRPHSILYTSGTSSQPKPVVLTYSNYMASARASQANLGVAEDDRWLCVLPLFHIGGLSILIRSVIAGTAAVVHERFDEYRVGAALESGHITLASFVATMLRRLQSVGLDSAPRLRAALIGGGPVPEDLLKWAGSMGLCVVQTYGMTETCSQVATLSPSEAHSAPAACGRPLEGARIEISDRGEILVSGAMVSQTAVSDDGWLHTGDRGYFDQRGLLHVEGRLSDVIVTGGENVACQEVEQALSAHPQVTDAAVVGRSDPHWGEVIVAYLVCSEKLTDAQVYRHCREELASYKVPKSLQRVDSLPRNAQGKLVRRLIGSTENEDKQ